MILSFQEFCIEKLIESSSMEVQKLGKASFDKKQFNIVLFKRAGEKWHMSIEVGETRNGHRGLYVGSIEVEVSDDFKIANINTSNCSCSFDYRKDMHKFLQNILDTKASKPSNKPS